eukprot:COSAG02_NODE_5039_length_4703_cov_4.134014_1_plen_239_part_00
MERKTAAVVGASGAIGRLVVRELALDARVAKVIAVVRTERNAAFWFLDACEEWSKVEVRIVHDVATVGTLECDLGFCCIGVYTSAVNSEEDFLAVEVGLNGAAGRAMKAGGAERCCYLSGQGAGKKRPMFSRVKGAAEDELAGMGFGAFATVRPPGIMDRPGEPVYGCFENCTNRMRCCLGCGSLMVRAEDIAWTMLSFSFAPADSVQPIYEAKDIKRVALEFQIQQNRTPTRYHLGM